VSLMYWAWLWLSVVKVPINRAKTATKKTSRIE
jgi:hypothetical protein